MSKKWKRIAALVVMITAMFAGTLNVSAEGVKDVFDAKYYADNNADLKAVFGYDEKALFNHYMTCGLNEGRCGSPTFDVVKYRKAYPDLEAAFGDDWDAYVNHYFKFGKAEGRTAGTPGAANAAGTAGNQQAAATQPASNSYIQHGSKFYDKNWTAIATQDRTWFGNESFYQWGMADISVYNDSYWTSTTDGAPEGYVIWTLKGAVRPHARYEKAKSVVESINTYDWYQVGWEAADTVKNSVKHKGSDDTFAIEAGGIKYENCSVHIEMESTKTESGRNVRNYTIRVCLPKGYKEFTATMLDTDYPKTPLVAYMPLP